MDDQEKRSDRRKIWILILIFALVAVAAISVTIWALFFREDAVSVLAPDYAPQEVESNAEEMEDQTASKLEAPEGGGAVTLNYQDKVSIDLSDRTVTLYYANPSRSTMNIVLQLLIQDNLIVQTGRLEPGHQLTKLDLEEDVVQTLQPGGYEGKFVISFYDVVTDEKSALNTEIPLTITVTE